MQLDMGGELKNIRMDDYTALTNAWQGGVKLGHIS
jgi:hypothetical protein